MRFRIIPVLLLKDGGLYKTVKFKDPAYLGDPINTVKLFNEKEADELVILDYSASLNRKSIDFDKIAEIAGEAFMPMAYGGGIKSFDDAKKVFDAGYEKVVLNSILQHDLNLVDKIASVYGAQSVIGSMDLKMNFFGKYKPYGYSATKSIDKSPVEWASMLEKAGVGEIMMNVVDRDGTWKGYDLKLIGEISRSVSVPIIACGGAGSVQDLLDGINAGASAVAAASMFVYQKKGMGVLINFPHVIVK